MVENYQTDGTPQPMAISEIAWVCHEANRAYCATQNDSSQLSWEECPHWQRASAIAGVRAILEHPEITAAQLHQSWLDTRASEGWVYGAVKDPEKRTHPCCVPYDQLPPSQQRKDALFRSIVLALKG